MRPPPRPLAVLLLSIGLAAAVPLPAAPALAQERSPATTDAAPDLGYPSDVDLEQHASLVLNDLPAEATGSVGPDEVLQSLTTTLEGLSPEAWDPVALAASLDGDPDRAFAFVRDSIGLDPYRGVLRGAAGTLAARAGSTADRAILLATLLAAMGLTTRFAFGDLDPDTAQALAERRLADPVAPLEPPPATEPQLLANVAMRAQRDHALLRSALGDLARDLGAASEPADAERLGRHTWVQVERDGRWIDLDPSLPDASPGDRMVPASATDDAILADERAALVIRVVAENLIDGAVVPLVALEQRLDAADAAATPVLLLFQPEGAGGGLLGEVGTPTAYQPMLWAIGDSWFGSPIPVLSTDDPFFGTGSDVRLTRLAIELETDSPGREPVRAERILLDRVSPEHRSQGSWTVDDLQPMPVVDDLPAVMLGVHQVVVSSGGTDPVKALESSIGAVFIAAELAKAEETGGQPPDDLPLGTMLLPLTSLGTQLALTSEHAIIRQLDASLAGRTYIGRPRLFLVSMGPRPGTDAGIEVTTDLAVDGIDVASTPADAQAVRPALQRLWYGAASTALETELVLRVGRALLPDGRSIDGVSFRMAEPLTVVTDVDALAGASATLAGAVSGGAVAVVPGDVPDAHLWWTIDRSDGTTRSILDPGIRAGFVGGLPGGFPLHWGADWDPATNNWVRWYDKTVVRRRCGGGNESLEVTECVVTPTTRQLGLLYVRLMRSYAQYLMLG